MRVGEVAALTVADISMSDRSGSVRIRQGKGLKARDVPLNATARRAIRQHLDHRAAASGPAALFTSSRETAMPVRTIQAVIASLAGRARLVDQLRTAGHEVRDEDLARVSPLMHAHVIANGSYFQSPRRRAEAAPEPVMA